jgi:hypothetical protein
MTGWDDSSTIVLTVCSGSRSRDGRREYPAIQLEGKHLVCFDRGVAGWISNLQQLRVYV